MAEPRYIGRQRTRTLGVSQSSSNTQGELAILYSHLELMFLFTCSVVMGDINPRDNEGMIPVHCAAHFGRAKHILLLNEGRFNSAPVSMCRLAHKFVWLISRSLITPVPFDPVQLMQTLQLWTLKARQHFTGQSAIQTPPLH